jgi:gamma-glutamylcyclotransferase (GGCT)/AIG2-like uncharacterized protein YtfP
MRLFLYGTLLNARTLASRGGQAGVAPRFVPASLAGWQRVALRNSRYPTLRRRRACIVRGALVVAPARALARLAAYEGSDYRLTRVVVRTTNGKTAAHTWIAPGGTRLPWNARGS